jgi:drug/metabolite transporter superfamily protein YnfA
MTIEGLKHADEVARPQSAVWYERLAWAAVAAGLASGAANPAVLARNYDRYGNGFLAFGVISTAAQLIWIWLVARKRQNWARWISLIVVLIGIPVAFRDNAEGLQFFNPISAIFWYTGYVLQLISVMLLFRGDAREWFSRKRFSQDT